MQVSPAFENKIKNLQKSIMKQQGKYLSLRDLTERISKAPHFDDLEKEILRMSKIDIKINLDRRKK